MPSSSDRKNWQLAGISPCRGGAATIEKLAVDPLGLVAFGTDDVQAAGLHHCLAVGLDVLLRFDLLDHLLEHFGRDFDAGA